MAMKIDVHQHLWTDPLVRGLEARRELPFVRRESGLTVLFMAGERPYVIHRSSEAAARRASLVERDGLQRALVCLSSPLGIEALPRAQSLPLIDAYHEGALALGEPFGVWGAVALDGLDPRDVESVLARGCVGVSLPAGALASVEHLSRLHELLAELERADAPLLVHPGPGLRPPAARAPLGAECSLADPLWWSALTRYVSDVQAAWLAFLSAGRAEHPRLRVIFSMLAGLAPLQLERLSSRGGPAWQRPDPLVFYETSSYGPVAVGALQELVGAEQLLYGSDRPVADPAEHAVLGTLGKDALASATQRALGPRRPPPRAALDRPPHAPAREQVGAG